VDAQFNLDINYDKGIGVEQSDTEEFSWYFKVAKSGHSQVQFNLANTYRDGRGVEANMKRAITLYEAASFNGIHQYRLIWLYSFILVLVSNRIK